MGRIQGYTIEDFESASLADAVDASRGPLDATHPGDILRIDFLEPLGMSANALARELRIPANRITKILNRERAVSADTALRLARYWGTSAQFWLTLQSKYDLESASHETREDIERIYPRAATGQ